MKNKIILFLAPIVLSLAVACNGDHSTKGGDDTAKNHYDAPSNVDTSKTTSATGDASTIDNSASDGTAIAKDTSMKKDSVKK